MKKISRKHAKQIQDKFKDLKYRKSEMLDIVKIPTISELRDNLFFDGFVWTMHLKNKDPYNINEARLIVEEQEKVLVSFFIVPSVNWNFEKKINDDLVAIMNTTPIEILERITTAKC